jgi:hypothetical protein
MFIVVIVIVIVIITIGIYVVPLHSATWAVWCSA